MTLNRRQLLTGATALAAAACSEQPTANRGELYEKFDGIQFRTGDGNTVTMNDLKRTLGSQQSVLTFGWNGCDQYCPHTNVTLGTLQRRFGNHNTIVVNVKPEHEGGHPFNIEAYKQALEAQGIRNPIVLYPLDRNGKLSDETAILAQRRLGAIVDQRNSTNHTPYIHLFDRNGNELDRVLGTEHPDSVADKLAANMAGRSR